MNRRTHRHAAICLLAVALLICRTVLVCPGQDTEPTEANLTRATASVLERLQFSRRPPDDQLSRHFLDRYLEALDRQHLLFLQSDLEDFANYPPELALLTLGEGENGKPPAQALYERYLKRLAQQVNFTTNLLQTGKFNFSGHDSWQSDRSGAASPRDLAAAQALWRDRVRADYLREKLAGTPPAEIAPRLARNDERVLQTMRRLDPDEILGIYLDALARTYDPHSDYFAPEEADNFNIEMNLSLVGIGGTLRARNGYCVIDDLIPGGPAMRSGLLHPGDRIVAVAPDGGSLLDILDLPLPQVVGLIRGPKGSTVRLAIIPAGAGDAAPKTVSVVRDEIKLEDGRAKAALIDLPQAGGTALRLGLIDLPSFYGNAEEKDDGASVDTARLLQKLKRERVMGLILDLRHNGGGSLAEAICLTGLFIPSGPVLQTRSSEGHVEIQNSPETNALYDGPLVVLTSRLSASASEIVAGALQDHGRALIVGDSTTFGKGTAQILVPLAPFFHAGSLGAVKVTMAKFYRPSGASTQLKGVRPDIVLPSATDLPDLGESKLPNALPWDVLPPVPFAKFDLTRPVMAELREKSRQRVEMDPGFRLVRKELVMAETAQDAKSLSLNEDVRRREKEHADRLEAELRKVLQTEAALAPPTYDITMAKTGFHELPPSGELALPGSDAIPAEVNPGEDIELRETESILADYIHALAARQSRVIVAGAKLEEPSQQTVNDK